VQFLLFDVSATLVFLLGYLAVVALQRRLMMAVSVPGGGAPPARQDAGSAAPARSAAPQREKRTEPCCREWPRLSAPR
jgi:hypothetical protein